jgi:hypothetical protein
MHGDRNIEVGLIFDETFFFYHWLVVNLDYWISTLTKLETHAGVWVPILQAMKFSYNGDCRKGTMADTSTVVL